MKQIKTIKQVIETLEAANISTFEYKEDSKLCGYELNTYTDGGVNQIIFVDFRDTGKDPKKAADFIELYNERINSIDIDEEIEINRRDKSYFMDFNLSESLKDFKAWKEALQSVFSEPAAPLPYTGEGEGITPGEWEAHKINDGWVIKEAGLYEKGFSDRIAELYEYNTEANAKAICKAVNETYGKGYNPAAMGELVEALQGLVVDCEYNNRTNFAFYLAAKAALSKAKL